MKFSAAIFDLDGTLLNTLDDLADAMNSVLRSMDAPVHPAGSYKLFVGQGFEMLGRNVLPENRRDQDTIVSCVNSMKAVYAGKWAIKTRPYDGIPELLDSLKLHGVPCAVLSNKAHEFTIKMVGHFFGENVFDLILGAGSVPLKPDPAGALQIAASLRLSPAKCMFVGDSGVDMQTATNAAMFPVGVTWGFRSREELLANGAKLLVDRPEEVLRVCVGA
jgi:phosphoglycolate phosphatase